MIKILKSTDLGLEPIETLANSCWVNLVNPGPNDIAHLSTNFDIPADFITAAMDIDERPRTEREDGTILIVLRVPHEQGKLADVPYVTAPLGIILTDRIILTVCKFESPVIDNLGHVRGLSTTKRVRFVLHLLLAVATYYLRCLRRINDTVDKLEDQLQKSLQNRELLELLKYQKSLTYFTTALKSNDLVLQRLQKSRLFHQYPEDDDLLDDVMTEIGQAIEMTKISSDILSQMMDAFASIISNNLNVVMKFLAAFTIILSLPTVVASIYGMNVQLPFQNSHMAFAITMGLAIMLSAVTTAVFWKKDWL
ncbi:MAG: magnesium transporter CorA family protein [Anaerolineae bacterium]|nr:magnesium transporter CorA family protein [Anaerolineae bacterium]